jgi:hypothetical protein
MPVKANQKKRRPKNAPKTVKGVKAEKPLALGLPKAKKAEEHKMPESVVSKARRNKMLDKVTL